MTRERDTVDMLSADYDKRHEAIIGELYGEMYGLVDQTTAAFYQAYRLECERALLEPWPKRKAVQRACSMYGLKSVQVTVFAERKDD